MSLCSVILQILRGLFIVAFFTHSCYLQYSQSQIANGIANSSTAMFNIDNSSVAQMFDTTAYTQEPFTQTTIEDDPTDYDYGSDEEDMVDAPVIDELDTEGMQADQPASDYADDNIDSQLSEKYDNNSMQNPRTAIGDKKGKFVEKNDDGKAKRKMIQEIIRYHAGLKNKSTTESSNIFVIDDNVDGIEADDWEATHKKVQEVYDYFVASQNKPTTQPTNILVTEDNASDNSNGRKYSNKIEGDDWEATHKRVQEIYVYFVALQNKPTTQPSIFSDTMDKAMKEYVDQEISEANVFADPIVDNLDLVLKHSKSMEQRLTENFDLNLMNTEMERNDMSRKTVKDTKDK